MRTAALIALITMASPAAAGSSTVDQFVPSWTALPTTHFSSWTIAPTGRILGTCAAPIPAGVVIAAFDSAADGAWRINITVDEIAQGWDPARRSALEDLRDAQRIFVAAAGGDTEARGQRFVAQLKQVVDDSGRSVAHEPSGGEMALSQAYDRVIRDAPDGRLVAIEASESAWIAYRDAFDRFALSMNRPDAGEAIRSDLALRRAAELQTELGQ